MQTLASVLFLCLLPFVQGGPYTKKGREMANSSLVTAAQSFLQERLLAVELQILNLSVDVGRLAERTTYEAYRLSEEAKVRIKDLSDSLQKEYRTFRPLEPLCFVNDNIKKELERLNNVTEEVYLCTHAVADEGTTFEVGMTVQLSEARNHIWNVQEAMYHCEKYTPQVDAECLKRLTVEGLQVLSRLPDRVYHQLDAAQAHAALSWSRLQACYIRAITRAEERRLSESQRVRKCVREGGSEETTLKEFGKMGKRILRTG